MRSFPGAVLLSLVVAMPAQAATFTFSTNLSDGPVTGIVAGTIDLPFASGTGAASSVILTSYPAALVPLSTNVTGWANQLANSFTIAGNTITGFQFFATTGLNDPNSAFCLNSGAAIPPTGIFGCPSLLNELHTSQSSFGYNFGGAGAVTFTAVSGAVPEPATWASLLLGLALTGGAMRFSRRQRQPVIAYS